MFHPEAGMPLSPDLRPAQANITDTPLYGCLPMVSAELLPRIDKMPVYAAIEAGLVSPSTPDRRAAARERRHARLAQDTPEVGDNSAIASMQIYLNDIGRVPRLTRQQEIDLSEQVLAGNSARVQLGNGENEHALEGAITSGLEAQKALIEANLRLAVHVAKKFYNKPGVADNAELLDLVQEGTIGLMKAAEGYDAATGNRFSTFAYSKISGEIKTYLRDRGFLIRLSAHTYEDLMKEISNAPSKDEEEILGQLSGSHVFNYLLTRPTSLAKQVPIGKNRTAELGQVLLHTESFEEEMFEEPSPDAPIVTHLIDPDEFDMTLHFEEKVVTDRDLEVMFGTPSSAIKSARRRVKDQIKRNAEQGVEVDHDAIEAEVVCLTDALRDIWRLHRHGMTNSQIAAQLGRDRQVITNYVKRAKKQLDSQLEEAA